ncbi:hypothetical protein MMSR116_30170 [Methylobacterium mesophilicum SR1.6/6]|uniref:Uncharacterized protein n=1 Tax=Methylobacterium mesophilicum SR1.6/6 TaxID=908290 RepID=A0A6B9G5S3_9HYPH|nr:hypothetical protein MMSR116_30170 [Methylobacterium mesophilicum SR1.6/6]
MVLRPAGQPGRRAALTAPYSGRIQCPRRTSPGNALRHRPRRHQPDRRGPRRGRPRHHGG